MPKLDWSDSLFLHQPQMDTTHREFVELLAGVRQAVDASRGLALERFAALIEHTEVHFLQEERWMQATDFGAADSHAAQHASVLSVMREVDRLARAQGRFAPLRRAIDELALWFPMHARNMDAALVEHMRQRGFEPQGRVGG